MGTLPRPPSPGLPPSTGFTGARPWAPPTMPSAPSATLLTFATEPFAPWPPGPHDAGDPGERADLCGADLQSLQHRSRDSLWRPLSLRPLWGTTLAVSPRYFTSGPTTSGEPGSRARDANVTASTIRRAQLKDLVAIARFAAPGHRPLLVLAEGVQASSSDCGRDPSGCSRWTLCHEL